MTTYQSGTGQFLLSVDPVLSGRLVIRDVDHFAEIDPNIRWAKEQVNARFDELSTDEATDVAAVFWLHLAHYLTAPYANPPFFTSILPLFGAAGLSPQLLAVRSGLTFGAAIRRITTEALATTLSVDSLRQAARETAEWTSEQSGSPHAQQLLNARDDLNRLAEGEKDVAPLIVAGVFLGGVALGALAVEFYHHHGHSR